MSFDVKQLRMKIAAWALDHRDSLAYDDADGRLLDVASGKQLRLDWSAVRAFEEKNHPETNQPYFVLLFDDALQIALVDPGGIAFAPSTENSGPISSLPPVVCLRDYLTLKSRVDHYLHEHAEEAPPRECLDLTMICIAILDGARAVGFDIGELEGELETSLLEIERRTS